MTQKHGGTCVKIPNGGRVVGTGTAKKFVQIKSPFDYLLAKDGHACALDCKTLDEVRFPYSAIKQHQLKALKTLSPQIPAGYLVWFRPEDAVVWFPVSTLSQVKPRTSLTIEDGFHIGTSTYGFNPFEMINL